LSDPDPEDDGPFPFVPNMLGCHGFDAVIGGGLLSRMSTVRCVKADGPCNIRTCRKANKPVIVPLEPEAKKWPGLFD
jgi:hypothetical protein